METAIERPASLNGYDLDGTLVERSPRRSKPFIKQSGAERAAHDLLYREHCRSAKLIRKPTGNYVIITGRRETVRTETLEFLRANNLNPLQICFLDKSRTKQNMIEFKLRKCTELGVTAFFEDDPAIAKALARKGINTFLVKPLVEEKCRPGTEAMNTNQE